MTNIIRIIIITFLGFSLNLAVYATCLNIGEGEEGAENALELWLDTIEFSPSTEGATEAEIEQLLSEAAGNVAGSIGYVKEGHDTNGALQAVLERRGVEFSDAAAQEATEAVLSHAATETAEEFQSAANAVRGAEASGVTAIAFKAFGYAMLLVAVSASVYHVATAPDPGAAAAGEIGGWALSITLAEQGAAAGAIVCSELGPLALLCGLLGGFGGGLIGFTIGSELGKQVWHVIKHPGACNVWAPDRVARCGVQYALTPPISLIMAWVANNLFD